MNSQKEKRITIRNNWSIGVIEQNLREYLSKCEMWGDLNITSGEYSCIKSCIAQELGCSPGPSKVIKLFERYPVLMVTDIVCYVLYEFNNEDFWAPWAKRYDIDINPSSQTEIGRLVRQILRKFNFEVIEDGGFTYVTPIICQAGIPSTCFGKLFDVLDIIKDGSYFNPREIVNDLMGYRSYLIDAPVERYFRLHSDRAIDLVVQLREMMHVVGDISVKDISEIEITGIPERIVKRFAEWISENNNLGKKGRKESQYFFSPKLVFDEAKGVCMFLPAQNLRQDSIYKLSWTIIGDDDFANAKIYDSQVHSLNGKNFTREAYVPVDYAYTYTIELRNFEEHIQTLTRPWKIEGLSTESGIIAFNGNGIFLSEKQRHIYRNGTLVICEKTEAIDCYKVNTMPVILPKSWAKTQANWVYPFDKEAKLTIKHSKGDICLTCNHSFEFSLVQTGTLFNEKYTDKEVPVYTRFPIIEVNGDFGSYNQESFEVWQIIIAHRLSNIKHTAYLGELDYRLDNDRMFIGLYEYAQGSFTKMYGSYDLRIFDGKTRKYLSFYLAPEINYKSSIGDIATSPECIDNREVFAIEKTEDITIEFDYKDEISIIPSRMGGNWEEIVAATRRAQIFGQIGFRYLDIIHKLPFKKTVRKLEWSFWNENEADITDIGKTKQFYLEDFDRTKWRLVLKLCDPVESYQGIKVVLESTKGEPVQSKEIELDRLGIGLISLSLFYDTMQSNPLPQRLALYITKGDHQYSPIYVALIKKLVQLKNPRYTVQADKPLIYWDRKDGNKLTNKVLEVTPLNPTLEVVKITIPEKLRRLKNREGALFEGIELDHPIANGMYLIDAVEEVGFSFFEEEEQTVPLFVSEYILCINGKQILEDLFSRKSILVEEWLSATFVAINKLEWINILTKRIREQIEQGGLLFDVSKCSLLLFSLIINSGEKSNLDGEIKSKVREVCELINNYLVTNNHRIEILQILLQSNIANSDCKDIINELQLYLFSPQGSVVFEKTSVQKMWEINDRLAILMNVRNCVKDIGVDIDRVISRIGHEAISDIITFSPIPSCEGGSWLDCFEWLIIGRCECRYVCFQCSTKVWGDGQEYSKLFTADRWGNWSRQIPDESHTEGFTLFGKNYLTLSCELIPETPKDDSLKRYIDNANNVVYKVQNLTAKYKHLFNHFHSVIHKRTDGNGGNQTLFYNIGCASILAALSFRGIIDSKDLQEMLPFWKNVTGAYSELVYRDLVLSYLYTLVLERMD